MRRSCAVAIWDLAEKFYSERGLGAIEGELRSLLLRNETKLRSSTQYRERCELTLARRGGFALADLILGEIPCEPQISKSLQHFASKLGGLAR
jgi:hypothetical protein